MLSFFSVCVRDRFFGRAHFLDGWALNRYATPLHKRLSDREVLFLIL